MEVLERISGAIREAGPVIDLREMVSLYAPLHETEPYQGVSVRRDLAYGPDQRHRADLFVEPGAGNRPVLLFVHGGGYIAGDRRVRAGSSFYDNVGLWGARHGFLSVTMSYRLAPGAPWPSAQEDIAAALAWLDANAAAFGGDPRTVVLMGHSAGATHAACFLGQSACWPDRMPVRAAILLSTTLQATADEDIAPGDAQFIEHERAYFGHDQSSYPARGALPGMIECGIPTLLVSPEFDPPFFKRHYDHLARLLPADRSIYQANSLAGHNHMSQIFCLNTRDTRLGDAILAFVRNALGRSWQTGGAPTAPRHFDGARS
ncbi:MAG: alpha/beta hydrolase [Candidatus Sphingomonas phytovorans]|nr:alpha/beta hydrolase [Sphingomonas sp.]WEK02288.1 MAG: alpha/beta hydrolase [Sphingomonas sp.]